MLTWLMLVSVPVVSTSETVDVEYKRSRGVTDDFMFLA